MNKLSVVLATHNEAKNLVRCLTSIQDLADEVVVVDGDSTDQTVKMAQQFGARIIKTSNKQNFHINKQMAIQAAKWPLVLQLDADEVVDADLHRFILQIKKTAFGQLPSAWWIKRKNYFLRKFLTKGGQYPDPVIRLFKNSQAYLPQVSVHEQLSVQGEVEMATGHLLHYSYPDFTTYMHKFNTYTSFSAQQLVDQGFSTGFLSVIKYFLYLPIRTFLVLAFRHKGVVDGFPGLIFALMSGLHFPISYLKAVELSSHQP